MTLLIALGVTAIWVHRGSRLPGKKQIDSPVVPEIGRSPAKPTPFEAPINEPPLNRLLEKPEARPVPEPVNAFLEEAYDRNAKCCLRLADQHQLAVDPAYAVALLQPQWDHRTQAREVIWFFAYQGAIWNGRKLSVFGAVDASGNPLFQFPRIEDDSLSFLESQYDGFQWVALDSPEISLIAALVEPTPENGAVLDFFLVKRTPSEPAVFWRFSDRRSPEEPVFGPQMCAFVDVDGDGYRDLASLALEADSRGEPSRPHAEAHPYESETGQFEKTPRPVSSEQVARLLTLYEKKEDGDRGDNPVFWRPPPLPASDGDEEIVHDDDESESVESEE